MRQSDEARMQCMEDSTLHGLWLQCSMDIVIFTTAPKITTGLTNASKLYIASVC